jgi:glycosyltransferase involved in cell wall biosynthesis
VSVIIPTRHRLHLLQRAIDSVNAQTYSNVEIVVFDNFSDKPILLTELVSRVPLKIVRSEVFERASVSRNKALRSCDGAYIAYLDDDDEYTPKKFSDQIAAFQRTPDVKMVYGNTEHRSQGGSSISSGPANITTFLRYRHIHPNSCTIRREVLDTVSFNAEMTTFEDVMFFADILRVHKVEHVDEVHSIWNRDGRPDQLTNKNYRRAFLNWKVLCEKLRPELMQNVDLKRFYFKKMFILSVRFFEVRQALVSLRALLSSASWWSSEGSEVARDYIGSSSSPNRSNYT